MAFLPIRCSKFGVLGVVEPNHKCRRHKIRFEGRISQFPSVISTGESGYGAMGTQVSHPISVFCQRNLFLGYSNFLTILSKTRTHKDSSRETADAKKNRRLGHVYMVATWPQWCNNGDGRDWGINNITGMWTSPWPHLDSKSSWPALTWQEWASNHSRDPVAHASLGVKASRSFSSSLLSTCGLVDQHHQYILCRYVLFSFNFLNIVWWLFTAGEFKKYIKYPSLVRFQTITHFLLLWASNV